MTDALREALAIEGLWVLIAAVIVAGIVRGFTGFGTALVYVPVAATRLDPLWVVITILVFDLFGPLPLVPRALRDGDLRDVLRLIGGSALGLVVGLAFLTRVEPVVFRWAISLTAFFMLALLASGWRYRRELSRRGRYLLGFAGGMFGGGAAAAGPPVILFYLGSLTKAARVRADIMLFLLFFDVLLLSVLAIRGLLSPVPVAIGLILVLPYTLGGLLGQHLFNPDHETLFRRMAYMVIAAAAVFGLPLLD